MKTHYVLQFGLIICLGFTGCAGVKNTMRRSEKTSQWNPLSRLTDSEKLKKAEKGDRPPETMAVIWKDSVLEKPGSTSVRGFGGRIFFYDDESTAVKSEGELIVYGFDDSSIETEVEASEKSPKADRKFVFKSEQFQSHFSETDLGGSYSVWIPWEKVGGYRKTITLIPVFKTADGRVLKSGQSITVLPGKNPSPDGGQFSNNGPGTNGSNDGVSHAGYETGKPTGSGEVATADMKTAEIAPRSRIKTSTISLTPGMASRLAAPMNQSEIGSPNSTDFKNLSTQLPASTSAQGPSAANSRTTRTAHEKTNSTDSNSTDQSSPGSGTSQRTVFGSPGSFR